MTLADRVRIVAAIAATAFVFPQSTAHAQSPEAEVLFRDGRDLIKHGKLAAGCDKLAASERLESSIGTLLNLGDCREKLGKLASAWAAFRKAEAMAKRSGKDDKRQAEAGRRAAQLEPKLSNLVIEVEGGAAGMVVRRDGEVIDQAAWNTPMPVDPGTYTIVAEAPGFVAWSAQVTVPAGAQRQVFTVPALERVPVAAPPAESEPAPGPRLVPIRRPGTWSTARRFAVAAGVLGAGAVGTGIYFGWRASDLQDRADRRCPLSVCDDAEGLRLNDQARTSALTANILYIAGGATLATAVVLWVVGAPAEIVVVPAAGDHQVGVSMTGRF
ncbi:MAG TPA: hypothetical protein VFD36_26860 [Kofleriaceae bacterium]|nr:hypothetical protein [Kofleriaceae bacterium]